MWKEKLYEMAGGIVWVYVYHKNSDGDTDDGQESTTIPVADFLAAIKRWDEHSAIDNPNGLPANIDSRWQEVVHLVLKKADRKRLLQVLQGGPATSVTVGNEYMAVDVSGFKLHADSPVREATSHERAKRAHKSEEMAWELRNENPSSFHKSARAQDQKFNARQNSHLGASKRPAKVYDVLVKVPFSAKEDFKALMNKQYRWDNDQRAWKISKADMSDEVRGKIEALGGSFLSEDASGGRLNRYRLTNMENKKQVEVQASDAEAAVTKAIHQSGVSFFTFPMVIQNLDLQQMVHIGSDAEYDTKIKRVDNASTMELSLESK